ncbi:MAG: hypothetical protein WKG07_19725 [Hymenobacter sp.]
MITFSLASFNLDRTKQELFQTNRMMLNIPQLKHGSDSIQRTLGRERRLLPARLSGYYTYLRLDTMGRAQNKKLAAWQVPIKRLPPSLRLTWSKP